MQKEKGGYFRKVRMYFLSKLLPLFLFLCFIQDSKLFVLATGARNVSLRNNTQRDVLEIMTALQMENMQPVCTWLKKIRKQKKEKKKSCHLQNHLCLKEF